MKSFQELYYNNVTRWDLISRFSGYKTTLNIPSVDKILVNLHDVNLKNKKDKYVLSFLLELLTGQMVSPKMLMKGNYKNVLVVKKSQPSLGRAQVTLRNKNLFRFLDRWIYYTMPKGFKFSGVKNFNVDKLGNISFYFDDIFSFLELDGCNSMVHKCNGIQLQFSGSKKSSLETEYLLSSFLIPLGNNEGPVNNREYPNLNFFNK